MNLVFDEGWDRQLFPQLASSKMPLINYGHSVLPGVEDKLVFFPPGPNSGSPGVIPSYATVGELGGYFRAKALSEVMLGFQLGGTFVTLLMIVFLTRRSQRSTWVFRWNALALFMNMARLISFILFPFTGLADPYSIQSDDLTMVRKAELTVPILQGWLSTVLLFCCYASLNLQSQSLSNTMYGWKRSVFLGFNYIMTAIPICSYLAQAIIRTKDFAQSTQVTPNWLLGFNTIAFAVCTVYQASLFVIKLGFAIHSRRKLGLKQFGPTQIAFIMFCQTMILPAFFAFIQLAMSGEYLLSSFALTFLSCLLPLSSFWAGVTSKKEREETAIRLNKTKKRARLQRQSSNSCTTLWFDNPEMARAHLESKKKKGDPVSEVTPEMGKPGPSADVAITPLSRAVCKSASNLERGYGPGYAEDENDHKFASIAVMNWSLTTLNSERREYSPHHSSVADTLGQRSDDGTATLQSMESDGLSSYEPTMGRSMITAPSSPYRVPEIFCDSPTLRHEMTEMERQPYPHTRLHRISEVPSILTRMGSQRNNRRSWQEDGREDDESPRGIRVEHHVEVHEERLAGNHDMNWC